MNDEIKVILNYLELYKNLEEGLLPAKDKKILLDYITNLQQENEMLKQADKNTYETSQDMMAELTRENERLKKLEYKFIDDSGDNESFTLGEYLDISNKLYDSEREKQYYKSRCEKAFEIAKDLKQFVYDELVDRNVSGATETHCKIIDLLNILNGKKW